MTELMQDEPIYFIMAALGTTLFLIKMLLFLVGGDSDTDIDDAALDAPGHVDGGTTFSLVSIQSILAFFMGAGWVGLACRMEWDMDQMKSAGIAAGFGFAMMWLSSFLTFKIKSLDSSPKVNLKEAKGLTGRTYTDIPAKGDGMGQVEVTVGGKQQILQAFSTNEKIKSFTQVKVIDVNDSGHLVVEKI